MTEPSKPETPNATLTDLLDRWNSFLGNGGFFNPGMTASCNEDALRQLVLDTRDFLAGSAAESEKDELLRTCPLGPNRAHAFTLWEGRQCEHCMQTKEEIESHTRLASETHREAGTADGGSSAASLQRAPEHDADRRFVAQPSPAAGSAPAKDERLREVQIEMNASYPIWGRLGVGDDVWAELQRREKETDSNRSSVYLAHRTFKTVMNALRHCGTKHYVSQPLAARSVDAKEKA